MLDLNLHADFLGFYVVHFANGFKSEFPFAEAFNRDDGQRPVSLRMEFNSKTHLYDENVFFLLKRKDWSKFNDQNGDYVTML